MKTILEFLTNIYSNQKLLLISIFSASVVFSLIFIFLFSSIGPIQHQEPPADYINVYKPIADNILKGEGITLKGEIKRNIPPGFSVVLLVIFIMSDFTGIDALALVALLNILFVGIASCLLFLTTKEIFSKRAALIASFLWMTYPFNLWFVKHPHTEMLFIPLFLAGIFFYILILKKKNNKSAILSGLLFGLSAIFRLIGIYLFIILIPLLLVLLKDCALRKRILLSVLLLFGFFAAIMPWGTYAFVKTGGFIPFGNEISPSGCVVYGITVLTSPMEDENNRATFSDDVVLLIEKIRNEEMNSKVEFLQFFGKELISNPVPVLKLVGLKITRSWYATSQEWWEKQILAVQSIYLFLGVFGLLYIARRLKEKISYIIFLLALILYFWAMTFLNVSILRFMVPIMPIVLLFGAAFTDNLIEVFKRK